MDAACRERGRRKHVYFCQRRVRRGVLFFVESRDMTWDAEARYDVLGLSEVERELGDLELVGGQRHDLLAVGAVSTIVFVAEDDILAIEPDQATVRYGDAVSVAREIGEHRFGSGEGRLGRKSRLGGSWSRR